MGGWIKQENVEYIVEGSVRFFGYGSEAHDALKEWAYMRKNWLCRFAVWINWKLRGL